MNIYLLARPSRGGYDTYDGAVVVAESAMRARLTHPDSDVPAFGGERVDDIWLDSWVRPDEVIVTLIGQARPDAIPGVVLSSFKAG